MSRVQWGSAAVAGAAARRARPLWFGGGLHQKAWYARQHIRAGSPAGEGFNWNMPVPDDDGGASVRTASLSTGSSFSLFSIPVPPSGTIGETAGSAEAKERGFFDEVGANWKNLALYVIRGAVRSEWGGAAVAGASAVAGILGGPAAGQAVALLGSLFLEERRPAPAVTEAMSTKIVNWSDMITAMLKASQIAQLSRVGARTDALSDLRLTAAVMGV